MDNVNKEGQHNVGIPYRAMFDFVADSSAELGIQEGDILEIIDRQHDWWMAILNGNRGLVPSNFLEPISGSLASTGLSEGPPNDASNIPITSSQTIRYPAREIVPEPPAILESASSPITTGRPAWPVLPGLTSASSSSSLSSPSLASPAGSNPGIPLASPSTEVETSTDNNGVCVLPTKAHALADVIGTQPGELSFKAGDIIDVEVRSTAEVWCGRIGSQVGTFHLDFSVEPILKERVRALWDYNSSSPEDLPFKAGDIIQVIGPSSLSNWWWHGWIEGKGIGTFPFNFVEAIENEFGDSDDDEAPMVNPPISKCLVRFRVLHDVEPTEDGMLAMKRGDTIDLIDRQTTEKWMGRLKSQTGTFLLDDSLEPIMTERVKALFDYSANNPEELDFKANDIITVVGPSEESHFWWYGALNGRLGMFPFNFIDLVPDERDTNSDSDEWVEIKGEQPQTVRALHNFCSKEKQDLNFDKGDIITVLDSISDPQWWKGELNGAVGMFPRTYCEVVSTEKMDIVLEPFSEEIPPPMYQEPAISEHIYPPQHPTIVFNTQMPPPPDMKTPLSPLEFVDMQPETPELADAPLSPLVPTEPTPRPKLALLAKINTSPSQKKLKDWLHTASAHRKEGNQYKNEGKLQLAFVHLTKAATCILDKIPSHPNYDELNPNQKANLTRNGGEVLEKLEELKPLLDKMYEDHVNQLDTGSIRVTALWNFESEDPDDLPFVKDDVVEVLDMPISTSWWRGQLNGRVGIFPCNYVSTPYKQTELNKASNCRSIPSPMLSVITEVVTPKTDPAGPNISLTPSPSTSTAPSTLSLGSPDDETKLPWSPCFVRGLYDFNASEFGELGFLKGDVFEVTSMRWGTWWSARLRDNTGIVPANYVQLIDFGGLLKPSKSEGHLTPKSSHEDICVSDEEIPQTTPIVKGKSIDQRESTLKGVSSSTRRDPETYALSAARVFALHAWNSGRAGELILQKGDVVQVLSRLYEHWWKGRLERDGSVGLFPANFVDAVPGDPSEEAPVARPLSQQPKRKPTLDSDEGIVILRANIAKLFPLLQQFEIERDLADNVEIQDLYRSSCILRRRVLRLLEEQPKNDALIQVDASFQEVKEYYDLVMALSASRYGRTSSLVSNVPSMVSSTEATAGSYSGTPFFSEPESSSTPFSGSKPLEGFKVIEGFKVGVSPRASASHNGEERRNTGGSTRMSLPPTPAPDPSLSNHTSFPFSRTSTIQRPISWRNSPAASGSHPEDQRRYDGRLSVIEADIELARKAYGRRSRNEEIEARRLPPSPAVRSLLRPRRIGSIRGTAMPKKKKSSDSTANKNIYKTKVEYRYNHVVHYTPHRGPGVS